MRLSLVKKQHHQQTRTKNCILLPELRAERTVIVDYLWDIYRTVRMDYLRDIYRTVRVDYLWDIYRTVKL